MAKDSFSLERASALVRKIESYWRGRGREVRVWIEPISGIDSDGTVYQVRSDMLNGLPR